MAKTTGGNGGGGKSSNPLGYDPEKTCGFYGGKTAAGAACQQPAGWKSEESDDGRCFQHDRAADDFRRTKKAQILEILPATGHIKQVCDATGITVRLLHDWRKADGAFREEFDSIIDARDKDRSAQVEDHVFNRILTDKASPAEIIFYLKNRDRDRWRDNYESPGERSASKEANRMAAIDNPKTTLTNKLRNMAKKAAEASRTVAEHQERNDASASEVADKIQKSLDKDLTDSE